jgi:hypothetical protein
MRSSYSAEPFSATHKNTWIVNLGAARPPTDYSPASSYGWRGLDLGHGFHETKHGLRFTISGAARCEVLGRLLRLNHERYAEEVAQGLHEKGAKKRGVKRARVGTSNEQL